MTKKKTLRTVGKTERKTVASVSDAVAFGTRLDELVQMRRVIASAIDEGAAPRDLSTLTLRLTQLSAEIEVLQAGLEEAEQANVAGDEEWDAEAV